MSSTPSRPGQRVRPGEQFTTTFKLNPKRDSQHHLRATHIDGRPAAKAVLSNDPSIHPGSRVVVRVVAVRRPRAQRRGAIIVKKVRDARADFCIPEADFQRIVALLGRRYSLLLDGPQGTGKTLLATRILPDHLGAKSVYFDCSAAEGPTDFMAKMELGQGAGGTTETRWVPTDILLALGRAVAEPDQLFIVCLDEYNRCPPIARNGIMTALDRGRRIYDPVTGRSETIPDNVLFIACINNGPQFAGTGRVDPAQFDRFAPVELDYPPEHEEVRLLAARYPSVAGGRIRQVVRLANRIRHGEPLGIDLSVRAADEVVALLADDGDFDLLELVRASFCGRLQGRWDDPASDAGVAWALVSGERKVGS
jgi:MoxR-like ATPase